MNQQLDANVCGGGMNAELGMTCRDRSFYCRAAQGACTRAQNQRRNLERIMRAFLLGILKVDLKNCKTIQVGNAVPRRGAARHGGRSTKKERANPAICGPPKGRTGGALRPWSR